MIDDKTLRRPIKIALLFSAITIMLYLFGPYKYPDVNRTQLLIFLAITNLSMYLGFVFGTKYILSLPNSIPRYSSTYSNSENNKNTFLGYSAPQIVSFLFWIALIVSIPKFILFTGAYNMSFSALLSKASTFFSSAQEIYAERQAMHSATGVWRYINYFVVLTGPFYWAYTPLALLFWRYLGHGKRVGSIFIWILFLMQYLLTGTNVGFFDFFITVIVVAYIKSYIHKKTKNTKPIKSKRPILLIIIVVLLLFTIFDITMGSRIGERYIKGGSLGAYRYSINEESFFWKYVPDSIKAMTAYLTRYLASSYNAVAFAIDMPFNSTFGLGHSWFILDNLSSSLSNEIWARTYNMQIESTYGFGHYGNWHTAYLWFANDVSFIGVPVLFFFLFYYFGRAWKRFLLEKDMFCFLRMMLFVKMCYFISANNQIFQNSDTLFAFWILAFITLFGRKCSMGDYI